MDRLRVFLGENEVVGADLEPGAKVSEALIQIGESMGRLERGELKEMEFNDSKKLDNVRRCGDCDAPITECDCV